MAKAKTKPRGANKYTPPAKSSAPAWIWLVAGIVIGCFIMFLMKLEPKQDIRPEQKTTTSITPKDHTTDKPKFVFRDLLSGKETATNTAPPVTPQEFKQLDGERAAALLDGKTPPPLPPVQQKPAPAPVTTVAAAPTEKPTNKPVANTPTTSTAEQKPTQVATIASPTKMTFFLQVGSYPSKQGAESIRAQLLMLGQNAKLETASSNGKTWYRVIIGSFATKEQASKTQSQLASHGFKQTLVVPRKVN